MDKNTTRHSERSEESRHYVRNSFGVLVRRLGFTMAEILLSLTIIGVVAAITLPSLTGNINERTWNTQRKALYARLSQALALMGNLNGYGEYVGTWSANAVTVAKDTAAQTFVTEGLAKVLKINNICDNEHLSDCGINSVFTDINRSKVNFPTDIHSFNPKFIENQTMSNGTYINPQKNINTKVSAFETVNGESIVVFYNPFCVSKDVVIKTSNYDTVSSGRYSQPYMCANFVYDLNGKKGPNTVGKDIGFMTAYYSTDTVLVAPISVKTLISKTYTQAMEECKNLGDDIRLATIDELMALGHNWLNFSHVLHTGYLSSTLSDVEFEGNKYLYSFQPVTGVMALARRTNTLYAVCVKRF